MMSAITRELKTPLNSIIGLNFCARKSLGGEDECTRKYLKPISNCSKFLLTLIGDILDYSMQKFERFELNLKEVKVRKLVTDVVEIFQLNSEIRGISILTEIDPDLPKVLKADSNRIRQVLLNLVSNALKFTYDGHVKIAMKKQGPMSVAISVTDTGVGMSKVMLREVLEERELEINPNETGLGMGLSISQKLAKQLSKNGITAVSTLKQGSTFSFSFVHEEISKEILIPSDIPEEPLGSVSAIPSMGRGLLAREPACKCSQVLVVDDNGFNIYTLKALLEINGVRRNIDVAHNGKQAVERVKERTTKRDCKSEACNKGYKMIFMDCNMPIMDGF